MTPLRGNAYAGSTSDTLNSKRFRLNAETLGIEVVNGKRLAVQIPAGAIVTVTAEPRADIPLVRVQWEGREVDVFTEDLLARSKEIRAKRESPRVRLASSPASFA